MQPVRLKELTKARNTIDRFLGYDHRPVGAAGSWYEAENLSTDFYPLLSVRRNRDEVLNVDGSHWDSVMAMCAKEHLCVLDLEGVLTVNGHKLKVLPGQMIASVYEVFDDVQTVEINDGGSNLSAILAAQLPGYYKFDYVFYEAKPWVLGATGVGYTAEDLGITVTWKQQLHTTGSFQIRWQNGIYPVPQVPRTMVSMGANVYIWPDKVWCNTVKLAAGSTMIEGTDYGSLEQTNNTYDHSEFTLTMCDEKGNDLKRYYNGQYNSMVVSASEPMTQEGLWLDTSQPTPVLKEWSVTISSWLVINSTYMRLEFDDTQGAANVEEKLNAGDSVTIYAKLATQDISDNNQLAELEKQLNGSHYIYATGDHFIVIAGIMPVETANFAVNYTSTPTYYCSVSRLCPELDFLVETGNRLWGCRYGLQAGEQVNEIYCCKLGDPKNWNVFQGLSTDSYTVSRGSDGPFTGAAVLDGHPLFFKEGCVEKVFPSASGAHQVQTQSLDGIQEGSGRSAVVIDDRLYYKGTGGVYVYTGTLPRLISGNFGDVKYGNASAASHGKKYCVQMDDGTRTRLMVYDTVSGIWQPENDLYEGIVTSPGMVLCTWKNVLYYSRDFKIYQVDGGNDSRGVAWHCESGVLGLDVQNHKYISNISLRYKRELGSSVRIYVQYDESGHWLLKETLQGTRLYAGTVSIWPRRCDTFRLKLEGTGGFTVYSLTFDRERGSDLR